MKKATPLLVLMACIAISTTAYAGVEGTTISAQKLCPGSIDIFKADNVESVLGVKEGEKVTAYKVVLVLNGEVYKWKYSTGNWNFKRIMEDVKKHAVMGSMLFLDEITTSSNGQIPQTGFYLR